MCYIFESQILLIQYQLCDAGEFGIKNTEMNGHHMKATIPTATAHE